MPLSDTPAGSTINDTRIQAFSERVHLAAEQKTARLKPYAEIRYFKGKEMFYDGLGAGLEAEDGSARFADVKYADLLHTRRKIVPKRWHLSLPWDGKDSLENLFDIQSNYDKKIANAMMRRFDRVGFEALTGPVLTGEEGTTSVTAMADGVKTINATGGISYETLLEADQNFIDADLGIEIGSFKKAFAHTGKEHTALMKDQKLTSGDYSRDYYMEKGRMERAAGFDLLPYAAGAPNPMLSVATAQRSCVAFTEGALCYGIVKDINVELRQDLSKIDTWFLLISGIFGAVRTEGSRVQIITTAE